MNALSTYLAAPFALAAALTGGIALNNSGNSTTPAAPAAIAAPAGDLGTQGDDDATGGFIGEFMAAFEQAAQEGGLGEGGWGDEWNGGQQGGGDAGWNNGYQGSQQQMNWGAANQASMWNHQQRMANQRAAMNQHNTNWAIGQARNDIAHQNFIQSIRQ